MADAYDFDKTDKAMLERFHTAPKIEKVQSQAEQLLGRKLCSGIGRVQFVETGAGISGKSYNEWIHEISIDTWPKTLWLCFGPQGGLVNNPDRLEYPYLNRRIVGVAGLERIERVYLEGTASILVLGDIEIRED